MALETKSLFSEPAPNILSIHFCAFNAICTVVFFLLQRSVKRVGLWHNHVLWISFSRVWLHSKSGMGAPYTNSTWKQVTCFPGQDNPPLRATGYHQSLGRSLSCVNRQKLHGSSECKHFLSHLETLRYWLMLTQAPSVSVQRHTRLDLADFPDQKALQIGLSLLNCTSALMTEVWNGPLQAHVFEHLGSRKFLEITGPEGILV